jgi:hypothetical protein
MWSANQCCYYLLQEETFVGTSSVFGSASMLETVSNLFYRNKGSREAKADLFF